MFEKIYPNEIHEIEEIIEVPKKNDCQLFFLCRSKDHDQVIVSLGHLTELQLGMEESDNY